MNVGAMSQCVCMQQLLSLMSLHVRIQLMSAVVNRNWGEIARGASLSNWKEVLAALVTFAGPEDFATLCGICTHRHTYVHIVRDLPYVCKPSCV